MHPHIIAWKPPPSDSLKLNFDDSVIASTGAAGFVIRKDFGQLVIASSTKLGHVNVLMAEAAGLRLGLLHARRLGLHSILVEGDSKILIDCLLGITHVTWRIITLVHDIKQLAQHFNVISFKHVMLEANFVADSLANLGHSKEDTCIWVNILPIEPIQALHFDSCITVQASRVPYFPFVDLHI